MDSRRVAVIAAALVLAACTTAPSPEPSGGPSPSAPIPSGSPGVPMASPTAGVVIPTKAPVVSCAPGPISVSDFLGADPRCYRSEDVTIAGWYDHRRPQDRREYPYPFETALRGAVPFVSVETHATGPAVFLDVTGVEEVIGWSADARWVEVVGRRAEQQVCWRDPSAPVDAAPSCDDHIVVSHVTEVAPPGDALAGCPVGDQEPPMTSDVFRWYPPACFGSRDVTVRGWLDVLYLIAGWEEPWGVAPGWLWKPIGPWIVLVDGWDAASPDRLTLWFDPARKVVIGHTNRWVLVTGHYADPAAATCHHVYVDPTNGAPVASPDPAIRQDDAIARRTCRDQFVVTSIVTDPGYVDILP
jgi:hypothetical protein